MRILITGANGAMAKETIKHLIHDGYTDILMAVRTEEKGQTAKREILNSIHSSKNVNLSVVSEFDMNKPLEIKKAVQKLNGSNPFDVIFLAAGFAVFGDNYQSIKYNGKKIEKTIFQNLIGSHIVFSQLKKNDLIANGARVVLAGGEGARGIKGMIEKPYFASPEDFRNYIYLNSKILPKYNPLNAIGISKFIGALWAKKIAELESENMEVVWFSPGLTSGSAGLKSLPFIKRVIFGFTFGIMNLLGKSQTPEQGGRKYADCLTGKVGKNGELIGAPAGKAIGEYTEQTPLNPLLGNVELKEELWKTLQEVELEY
jgi:nucleoside-diphosphate-sugar epimerase